MNIAVHVILLVVGIAVVLALIALRLAKVFKGSVASGWNHLVIRTAAGEIGFYVPDTGAWLQSLGEVTGLSPGPVS